MVKQLKQLKASAMVKKTDKAGTSDQNANKLSNEQDSDGDDIDDAKLTKAIASLVASIPKPSKREPTTSDLDDSPPRQRLRSVSPDPGTIGIGLGILLGMICFFFLIFFFFYLFNFFFVTLKLPEY